MKITANFITSLRIILSPFIIYTLITGHYIIAFCLYAIAAISDLVDGYYARHFDVESDFGTLLDPIADKALLLPLYIYFAFIGLVPWILIILLFFRDLYITSYRLISDKAPSPSRTAKFKSFLLFLCAAVAIASLQFPSWILKITVLTLLTTAVALSLYSLFKYIFQKN